MVETPADALSIMMLIAVICIVRSGVSVIGRCAEIIFYGLILIYFVNIFSFMVDAKYENILPMFENGLGPIFKGAYPMFSNPFLENILFLFLLGNMTNPEQWKKVVISSSLICGIMYASVTFFAISLLGADVIANLTYPTYFIVRTISIADFFERYEIIVSMIFYLTIFFRMALLLYITAKNLTSIFGLKDYRSLLVPIALITISLQKDIWSNTVEATQMLKTAPIIHGGLFGLILPCILCVIGAFRGKKNQS
ncbi:Spore germination protein [compost metagenome]